MYKFIDHLSGKKKKKHFSKIITPNGALSVQARYRGVRGHKYHNAGMSVILEGCLSHIFMCIKLTLNGLYKRAHIPMLCYNEVSIKSSIAKYGDEA